MNKTMIKITARSLAQIIGCNISKTRRNMGYALEKNPKIKGYTRYLTKLEGFQVFLFTILVSELGVDFKSAKSVSSSVTANINNFLNSPRLTLDTKYPFTKKTIDIQYAFLIYNDSLKRQKENG